MPVHRICTKADKTNVPQRPASSSNFSERSNWRKARLRFGARSGQYANLPPVFGGLMILEMSHIRCLGQQHSMEHDNESFNIECHTSSIIKKRLTMAPLLPFVFPMVFHG